MTTFDILMTKINKLVFHNNLPTSPSYFEIRSDLWILIELIRMNQGDF